MEDVIRLNSGLLIGWACAFMVMLAGHFFIRKLSFRMAVAGDPTIAKMWRSTMSAAWMVFFVATLLVLVVNTIWQTTCQ